MWGPQDSVQLVNITPITMVYGTCNYSYWGESKPTLTGGPHIVSDIANWDLNLISNNF